MKKNDNLENPLTLIVSSAECFCRSAMLDGAVRVAVVVADVVFTCVLPLPFNLIGLGLIEMSAMGEKV